MLLMKIPEISSAIDHRCELGHSKALEHTFFANVAGNGDAQTLLILYKFHLEGFHFGGDVVGKLLWI